MYCYIWTNYRVGERCDKDVDIVAEKKISLRLRRYASIQC